jgi:hypothetical protein
MSYFSTLEMDRIGAISFATLSLFIVGGHLFLSDKVRFSKRIAVGLAAALLLVLYWVIGLSTSSVIHLREIIAFTSIYSALLFVVICEAMILGLAVKLTRWRGEHWTKELDYVYLAFGSVGLLMSINRLPEVSDRAEISDVYGPLVLATALVLRAIKTRAEIGGWNQRLSTIELDSP